MKVIATEKAPGAIGPYSQGFVTNGFVYTSGQIPVNPADGTIPAGIAAQAAQSCKNVGAILEAGGSSFEKVVKTTCFLADIADFAAFNEVYANFFTSKPARSCVAVKDLPKGVLCEIDAIAAAYAPADFPLYCRKKDQNRPAAPAGGSGLCFLFGNRTRCPDVARGGYFRNLCTARATMPPRMPETRNSATPCTPTSRTTNMRGLAAPLTDTRFWT